MLKITKKVVKMGSKKNKTTNKAVLALIVSFVLAAALTAVYMQNVQLKEQINNLNMEYERGAIEGVNDFTLMIIDKLKTCQPVALMSGQESRTVVDTSCLEIK